MRFWRTKALLLLLCLSLAMPRTSFALGRDKRTLMTAGLYGALAGTLMGFIALPATHTSKSVLIGTSVGLYLGLVVGLYHMNNRDDPQNPLNPKNAGLSPGEIPAPELLAPETGASLSSARANAKADPLRVDYVVYRF